MIKKIITKYQFFFALKISIVLHILIATSLLLIPKNKSNDTKLQNNNYPGLNTSKKNTVAWLAFNEFQEQYAKFFTNDQASLKNIKINKETPKQLSSIALEREEIENNKKESVKIEIKKETKNKKVSSLKNGSNRDSDPTIRFKVNPKLWKLGKPLSKKGIKIYPKKPAWTALQRVLRNGINPIVSISFNSKGKVGSGGISFIRDTNDFLTNHVIKSNCASWEASGEKIEKMNNTETLKITFEIILDY